MLSVLGLKLMPQILCSMHHVSMCTVVQKDEKKKVLNQCFFEWANLILSEYMFFRYMLLTKSFKQADRQRVILVLHQS